jgi:hypothetical protein
MSGSGERLRGAVDGRVLVMKPTGIGRYARSLMEALALLKGEAFRPVFFTHDRILDQSFWPGQFEQKIVRFPDPMAIRPVWDDLLLPRAIRREGPFDLYFSPLSVVPGGLCVPSVATIHDLAFYRDPGVQPWKYRRYWKRAIRRSVRHATKLIAVSESTRQDLQRFFPGSEEKTRVVHEAPAPIFHHPLEEGRHAFSALGRYFLAVGTLEPRKNYPFLIEVFQRLLRRPGCDELKLAVAGGPGWWSEEVEAWMEQCGTFLVRLDYVEYEDLPELYHHALGLVFPRSTKASGCPRWKPWLRVRRVSPRTFRAFPRWWAMAGGCVPWMRSSPGWMRWNGRRKTSRGECGWRRGAKRARRGSPGSGRRKKGGGCSGRRRGSERAENESPLCASPTSLARGPGGEDRAVSPDPGHERAARRSRGRARAS